MSLPIFSKQECSWNIYNSLCIIIDHIHKSLVILYIIISYHYCYHPRILCMDRLCHKRTFTVTKDTDLQCPVSQQQLKSKGFPVSVLVPPPNIDNYIESGAAARKRGWNLYFQRILRMKEPLYGFFGGTLFCHKDFLALHNEVWCQCSLAFF